MLRFKIFIWCSLFASLAAAQGPVITVSAPPADPRITYPQIETRPAGTLQRITAEGTEKATWTVLRPFGYREATVVSDTVITVTVPREPLWILADLGERSQLVVINAAETPPPTPPPVPPTPPPVPPPTPPVPPVPDVVPDSVINTLGIGHDSFKWASQVKSATRATEAASLASAWREAAYQISHHQVTAAGAWGPLKSKCPATWLPWWDQVEARFTQLNNESKVLSTASWASALREVASSLEVIK